MYLFEIPAQLPKRMNTVGCRKNGNCENKSDTFLQIFHSVKSSYEMLELASKFNDICRNYLIG
jgi:hypothetical protein